MVLLAAAVCNKGGKAIISRQFVEMNRSRIEGLLAAFPKLMNSGKQHTFVETESVRYVYQPLEKLYMLLITTKASNILEDLETLRLFARVIPEYCRNLEESDIVDQAFQLIFSFDEIVALGYRENVNLAQIRTFTEMDSHEEKVFLAVRQTQEKEAKDQMRKRAKELQRQRHEAEKGGRSTTGFGGGGFGSSSFSRGDSATIIDAVPTEPTKPAYTAPSRPSGRGKAMDLRSKKKDVDSFVGQLMEEGEKVTSVSSSTNKSLAKVATPAIDQEGIHIRVEENISVTAGRDGGLQSLELHGIIKLKINDEKMSRAVLSVVNNDKKGIQMQTHPNIDKKLFASQSLIGLKNADKPFPLGQDIGVLKWRFSTQDESYMPLSINCWPNESGNGCDVNIEYELEQPNLELNDVTISIPIPSGVGAPIVGDCDGEYNYDSRKNVLQWNLTVIDASNKSGSMEFSVGGHPDDFFPVDVSFMSKKSYCDLQVQWLVQNFESKVIIPISTDTDTQNAFKYQIDKPAANNWRLKIQNVQESDVALYICRVQLGGQQNANDSRMISVIQKPQIIDIYTSSDTTKNVGDRLELNCRASGIPEPIVTWRMAGGGVLPTGGREVTSPSITVEHVEKEHRGAYKCIALNRAGTDVRNIYLSVQFAPDVSANNNTLYQAVGYNRELSCEAYGNPPPTDEQIYWSKTGTGVKLDNQNKYALANYFGSNYVLMKLLIKDVSENDYGDYRCYAENLEGSGQNTVTLRRSESYVPDRPMGYNTGSLLTFSITTIAMLLATALLHCC